MHYLENKYKYTKNLIISLILPSLGEEMSLLLTLSFELPKHIKPDSFTEQVTEVALHSLISFMEKMLLFVSRIEISENS